MTAPTQGVWALVLLAAAVVAFGLGGWRILHLYRLMRLGAAEDRTNHVLDRVRDELRIFLGQRKLMKRPYWVRGIGHALIFWGFLVITWGSADLLLRGILGWHMPFTDTLAYAWLLDLFAVAVLGAVILAWGPRAIPPPPPLQLLTGGHVLPALIHPVMHTPTCFARTAGRTRAAAGPGRGPGRWRRQGGSPAAAGRGRPGRPGSRRTGPGRRRRPRSPRWPGPAARAPSPGRPAGTPRRRPPAAPR